MLYHIICDTLIGVDPLKNDEYLLHSNVVRMHELTDRSQQSQSRLQTINDSFAVLILVNEFWSEALFCHRINHFSWDFLLSLVALKIY